MIGTEVNHDGGGVEGRGDRARLAVRECEEDDLATHEGVDISRSEPAISQ